MIEKTKIKISEIVEILKIEREVLWQDRTRHELRGAIVTTTSSEKDTEDEMLRELAGAVSRKLREAHRYTAKTVYQCAECGTTTNNREHHNEAHASGAYGEGLR